MHTYLEHKIPVLDVPTALDAIVDINEWRSLGVHLGIKSSKLDEIGRCSIEEQKTMLVKAWFECDASPSLDKLHTALSKPSVGQTRVAEKVDKLRRTSLVETSGSVLDVSVSKDGPNAMSAATPQSKHSH